MKLKNVLVITFLILTLIPTIIVSMLLYKSGFELSKESYMKNLQESINVQVDFITQTLENSMISDSRFIRSNYGFSNSGGADQTENLFKAFEMYLEMSEDKISVCILLDENDVPVYSIGEKNTLDMIRAQLPRLDETDSQLITEFQMDQDSYSLGIITPVRDQNGVYEGSLISVFNKSYLFKSISSYYKIADSATYIYRENGEIVSFRQFSEEEQSITVEKALADMTFSEEGTIDVREGMVPITGYYRRINNSPWYLLGVVDEKLIFAFINQFIVVYLLIILGVFIADVILSVYFSRKVVEPINGLIKVMEGYQNSLDSEALTYYHNKGYYETQYLHSKFKSLMKTILLVQHNFKGVYQLYQSSDMGDINIDIDVKQQTIHSNKDEFRDLMNGLEIPENDCVVERFVKCFCQEDQDNVRNLLENMRDEHLAVTKEAEIYTPYLNRKWFHILVVPMYEDERLSRLFIQLRDISSFKKHEYESNQQARRDALTGLYNRTGFTECVEKVFQEKDAAAIHGLLFIDMDYFKLVNDNFGHKAGDELLCAVGRTLLEVSGLGSIVSRFGGDEFAVFLPGTSAKELNRIKDEIGRCLIYPFDQENTSFVVSASIGVSVWSSASPDSLEQLLQQADAAMYKAKRERREDSLSR